MPADGLMRASTGYDAPADGHIYHLTKYFERHTELRCSLPNMLPIM